MELELVDLDKLSKTTYSAVFSDICDQLGLRNQVLPNKLSPRTNTNQTLLGWARPLQAAPIGHTPSEPYAAEIKYVDSLAAGDVVVADCSGSTTAFWGELFSAAAKGRGARGAVINGAVRDVLRIEATGFEVHSRSIDPRDSLGRLSIVRQDSPIQIGSVTIVRGDLIISDKDGTVVIPRSIAGEAIVKATSKVNIESSALSMLADGAYLADAWKRYGVL